jgi:hypothetical protein
LPNGNDTTVQKSEVLAKDGKKVPLTGAIKALEDLIRVTGVKEWKATFRVDFEFKVGPVAEIELHLELWLRGEIT